MSCDWPLVTIESLQAKTKGSIAIGPFGSRMKSDCYVDDGVPVIRGMNITRGPLFEGDFVYVTEEKADELGACNVYQNDLVFPHRGAIGEVGIVLEDKRYVLSSSLMKLTCDSDKVRPKYLYYFFKSRLGKYELLKNASQVGTPGIGQPLSSLKSIKIKLPPLREQDFCEQLLTSLDEKITLNTQINQTLEQMVQALFKSWFVDFDPVIDNALDAGNPIPEPLAERAARRKAMWATESEKAPARLPAETRRLFPDRFEKHDVLGWIPVGWTVKPLDQVARYQNGLALQRFRPNKGEEFLPVLKIAQLRARKTDGVEKASANIKPECIVHNGDVVFSWSGTLMIDIWSGGKAALNQHLFKVTSDKYPKWFYFLWTQRHLELFQRIAADKAVTMGHIKRQHLAEAFCLVPEDRLISKAGESIRPLIRKC